MNSRYNYENRPTNAQMHTQYNLQYGLNHVTGTIKSGWNSLTLLQKIVLIGIFALGIYFIIKLIQQQRQWASIKASQTEPLFLSNLEWDSSGKKIYIGNKALPVIPSTKLPEGASGFASGNPSYTYNFWIFMNENNPFVPGADGATGKANISDKAYNKKMNNLFYRSTQKYKKSQDTIMTPSVWFGGQTNNALYVKLTVAGKDGNILETIEIDDIAVNEWVNVTVTVSDNVCNVFINSKLERSTLLKGVAKAPSKTSDLHIGGIGDGFPGEMAYLQYYSKVLTPQQIEEYYQYYLRKITDFMNNFNHWALDGNLVPAVPTDVKCLPDGDDGFLSGLENVAKNAYNSARSGLADAENDASSDMTSAKADVSSVGNNDDGKGSGSNANGHTALGGLQADYSSLEGKANSVKQSAVKTIDNWENKASSLF